MSGLDRAWRRIQHALGLGRVTAAPVDDAGNVQTAQIQFNDLVIRDGVPILYHFGFAACPPAGTDVATVSLQGDPSSTVAIASNNQAVRPKNLQPGEVQVYDLLGRSIYFTAGNGLVINANNTPVTVNGATAVTINAANGIALNGDTAITGKLTVSEDATIGGKSFLGHKHGDVQSGGAQTSAPV